MRKTDSPHIRAYAMLIVRF